MRLIVLENEAMISDVVCGREALYIGSREGCSVHIPDSRVAPQQAVIHPEGPDGWLLQQLAPETELHVNGMTVTDRVALKTGDEIQLHDFLIRVFPEYEGGPGRTDLGTSVAQLARFAQSQLPHGALVKKTDDPVQIQQPQLQRIGRVNVQLAPCTTVEQLMDIAIRTLHEVFAAHRVWIGVRRVNYGNMEYVEGRLLTGQSTDLTEHGENLKPRVLDRGQFILLPLVGAERTSVLIGPLAGPDGTLGMLYMDTGETGRRFDPHDLDHFIVLSNALACQLDAIFKAIAKNRAATMEGEVIVAHEIQARLTPRKLPQWDQLQFGAFREPGRERTGDIYDVIKLASKTAAVMLAYTRATGAVPSMLMCQAHASFRTALMHQAAPHVVLRSLNWLLYDGREDHALDCFVGLIDPETGKMEYAVAGEVGAYIIDQRGAERRLGGDDVGPSLSLNRTATYSTLSEELEPDETLVLFTPGVTTAKNGKGETFGQERFVNILCDGFGQLASSMLKEMLTDLRNFTEGGQQPDDITVLLAHRV